MKHTFATISFNIFCRGAAFGLAWLVSSYLTLRIPDSLAATDSPERAAITVLSIFAACSLMFGIADGLTHNDQGRVAWWGLGCLVFACVEYTRISTAGSIGLDVIFASFAMAGLIPAVVGLLSGVFIRRLVNQNPEVHYYYF